MRNFVLGIIVATPILLLVWLGYLLLGFFPTSALTQPSKLEFRIAGAARDASVARQAPQVTNPIAPTDENVIDGMVVYTANCALCHGGLDLKPGSLAKNLFPPAPQLLIRGGVDDPERQVFYITRTGIRNTGMPGWQNVLSEQDMWKITMFLNRVRKLSPAAKDFWKQTGGAEPPAGR